MDNRLDEGLVRRTLEACRRVMTVDEIAESLEVSRVTVYNWLNGRSTPYRKERNGIVRLAEKCRLGRLVSEWNAIK